MVNYKNKHETNVSTYPKFFWLGQIEKSLRVIKIPSKISDSLKVHVYIVDSYLYGNKRSRYNKREFIDDYEGQLTEFTSKIVCKMNVHVIYF